MDQLIRTIATVDLFSAGCWHNEEGISVAAEMIQERGEDLGRRLEEMNSIMADLSGLAGDVTRHRTEWNTLVYSAAIQEYVLEHLLAATRIKNNDLWNLEMVRELDNRCLELLDEIERDWDRNRYPDDVNKDGLYQDGEHLLHKFRSMHRFHAEILQEPVR